MFGFALSIGIVGCHSPQVSLRGFKKQSAIRLFRKAYEPRPAMSVSGNLEVQLFRAEKSVLDMNADLCVVDKSSIGIRHRELHRAGSRSAVDSRYRTLA